MKKTLCFAGFFVLALAAVAAGQKKAGEIKTLKVTRAERAEFKGFLKNKRAGIVKLRSHPCAESLVVDAGDECAARSDESMGSHYSFFAKVYFEKFRHVDYSTLSFVQDEFVVKNNGRLVQLLVDLGEREIDQIDDQTEAALTLGSFPLFDKTEREKFKSAGDGYEFRGLKMTDRQKAGLNRTFLLRSLFYTWFHSLTAAKKETMYAFRVVRREDDVVTILWKEIYSRYL